MSGAGPPPGDRRQPGGASDPRHPGAAEDRHADRAALRPSRLQVLVAAVLLLGLAQILYEDVVLFIATTTGGVAGVLSSPLVAIGVPLTIAALLIALLVGGALLAEEREGRAARAERPPRDREDPASATDDPPGNEHGDAGSREE